LHVLTELIPIHRRRVTAAGPTERVIGKNLVCVYDVINLTIQTIEISKSELLGTNYMQPDDW